MILLRQWFLHQITKKTIDWGGSPVYRSDNFFDEKALLVDDKAFGYCGNSINSFDGTFRIDQSRKRQVGFFHEREPRL